MCTTLVFAGVGGGGGGYSMKSDEGEGGKEERMMEEREREREFVRKSSKTHPIEASLVLDDIVLAVLRERVCILCLVDGLDRQRVRQRLHLHEGGSGPITPTNINLFSVLAGQHY